MYRILFLVLVLGVTKSGWAERLTFEMAWQRVLNCAPALAAAEEVFCSLQGEAEQVKLSYNPVFEVESENIGINKTSDKVEPPQTTFSLTQTFEFNNKRVARYALAMSQSYESFWDNYIQREDAWYDLNALFIAVRAAQEKWELAQKKLSLAESRITVVKKQIINGKVSPLHEKKSRLEMLSQTLSVREAKTAYEQACISLAAQWGSACPDFEGVEFELYAFCPPPCYQTLLEGFYRTPDYTRARQAVVTANKNLHLQKVNRIPDLTVMGGYRIFHDSHQGAWVVGAAFPLPFFNRNQGSVQSALSNVNRAHYDLEEVEREGSERITTAYERLNASYEESRVMYGRMVREAEESVQLMETGYEKGKIDYLELLEAHIMLVEIQERFVDILTEYHLNRAELARLTGIKL